MRPTGVRLAGAAMLFVASLTAFAAILAIVQLAGRDSPFVPGLVSGVLIAALVFMLKRYEGRRAIHPFDPRRRRVWLWSSMAAAAFLAAFGLIAAGWIHGLHLQP